MLGFVVNMLLWINSYGIYYEVLNMLWSAFWEHFSTSLICRN
jgi:hypothetical protein